MTCAAARASVFNFRTLTVIRMQKLKRFKITLESLSHIARFQSQCYTRKKKTSSQPQCHGRSPLRSTLGLLFFQENFSFYRLFIFYFRRFQGSCCEALYSVDMRTEECFGFHLAFQLVLGHPCNHSIPSGTVTI